MRAALLLGFLALTSCTPAKRTVETHTQDSLIIALAAPCGMLRPEASVELMLRLVAESEASQVAPKDELMLRSGQAFEFLRDNPRRINCGIPRQHLAAVRGRLDRTSPPSPATTVLTGPNDTGWQPVHPKP